MNLFVNINNMSLKVPTCKESPVTLVADVVICFACVCVPLIHLPKSTLRVNMIPHLEQEEGFRSL